MNKKQLASTFAVIFLFSSFIMGGCTNVNPTNPPGPYTVNNPPSAQLEDQNQVTVIYNYNATDKVQLSANNITMKVGQKLVLQPAKGLTKVTRFVSSGENFFGTIMKQVADPQTTGKAVFEAIKPGKGKLQIIPNGTETNRAVDLWVTVQ
jgi:hypothetical protein